MSDQQPRGSRPRSSRMSSALTRYRVMAWLTGVFLLVLTVEMFLKYVLRLDIDTRWVAITHGWVYMVYLVTVVDLWSTVRWRPKRLVSLVLAGVVPVLSFVAEKRTTREVQALVARLAAAGPGPGRAPSQGSAPDPAQSRTAVSGDEAAGH